MDSITLVFLEDGKIQLGIFKNGKLVGFPYEAQNPYEAIKWLEIIVWPTGYCLDKEDQIEKLKKEVA